MSKPCLYKQNPSVSSLPLLRMLLPQAIPQTPDQEKKLPHSSAPVLLVGVSTSLFRCLVCLDPGAGMWSPLHPAVKGALMNLMGSSCPELCPGKSGPVACQAHYFLWCIMEAPLCSLSWAEGLTSKAVETSA